QGHRLAGRPRGPARRGALSPNPTRRRGRRVRNSGPRGRRATIRNVDPEATRGIGRRREPDEEDTVMRTHRVAASVAIALFVAACNGSGGATTNPTPVAHNTPPNHTPPRGHHREPMS